MYRPKKYIRLNQLPRMPRLADVKNLHEEGKKARSCTVELPWRTEKLGMTFSLTVRCDPGNTEPVWTLYEGEGSHSRVMWSTGFGDVDLLYDVLTLSLPADGPNIFAPQKEDPKPKPAAKVEPQPDFYEQEKYRSRPSTDVDAGMVPRSPFLDTDDMFLKPEEPSFVSYASQEKKPEKPSGKDEFALPAVPEKSAYKTGERSGDKSVTKAEPAANPADSRASATKMPPASPATTTSDMANPLAEPQVSMGASHPDAQSAQPGGAVNPSLVTGGYPQMPPGYPPGYAPPGYPPGYPMPPGYPQGYPPQPGYPQGYPPQPGYPGVSGQYPAAQYPPGYPPYGQPPYPAVPIPAGTVPVGPGMPGVPPDAYGGLPGTPVVAQRRPQIMLGTFLMEAGLVPKSTIDSALQVQVLVSQGTLSPVKAAEAVRRAHLRGGGLEPDQDIAPLKPGEGGMRIRPQIGQVLVMAGIITAVQLKAALYLQDAMRSGNMTMEEAVELLKREATPAQVKSQDAEQLKAPVDEDLSKVIELARKAGLVTEADLVAAHKVKAKHGGEISKILVVAGKLDQLTLDSAKACQKYLDEEKLRIDQAIQALHYCQRMRVPLEEAASELGLEI